MINLNSLSGERLPVNFNHSLSAKLKLGSRHLIISWTVSDLLLDLRVTQRRCSRSGRCDMSGQGLTADVNSLVLKAVDGFLRGEA